MTFQFELPKACETRDLIALNKVVNKLFHRWWMGLFRGASCVFGALLLLGAAATLFAADFTSEMLPVVMVPAVLGVVWLAIGIGTYRFSACASRRLLIKDMGFLKVSLDDAGVTEETQNKGVSHYAYSAFVDLARYRNTWFLFLDKKHALILPERCLVCGSAFQLEGFLSDQTGLPIKKW